MAGKRKPEEKLPDIPRCLFGCWKKEGEDVVVFQNRRHRHYLSFDQADVLEQHLINQYGVDCVKDGSIPASMRWWHGKKADEFKNLRKQPQMAVDGRDYTDRPRNPCGTKIVNPG